MPIQSSAEARRWHARKAGLASAASQRQAGFPVLLNNALRSIVALGCELTNPDYLGECEQWTLTLPPHVRFDVNAYAKRIRSDK